MIMARDDGWRCHKVDQVTSMYVTDSQWLFDDVEKKDKKAAFKTIPKFVKTKPINYISVHHLSIIKCSKGCWKTKGIQEIT